MTRTVRERSGAARVRTAALASSIVIALLAGTATYSGATGAGDAAASSDPPAPSAGARSPEAGGPEGERLQNMLANRGRSLTLTTVDHLAEVARSGADPGEFRNAPVPYGRPFTVEVVCEGTGAVLASALSGTVEEYDDDMYFVPLPGAKVAGRRLPCSAKPRVRTFTATVAARDVSVRVVPEAGSTGLVAWAIIGT